MARNPKWARDEIILALELYFRVNPRHTSDSHPEIIALSELLNQLPIHALKDTEENFRNPNGVYMKLCNFLSFDPEYGGVGLKSGSKLDRELWDELFTDRARLIQLAQSIRENHSAISRPGSREEEVADQEEEFPEGRVLTRTHKSRERNRTLTKRKKETVLTQTGKLACEVCGFVFKEKYGEIGDGFAECHHNKPVSELKVGDKTKLSELSIVCANCHHMIHKTRPCLSADDLKKVLI
ncbi:MAG: HNH endonuclease [Sedimenticola sp.]|nr:MAG: HNH endonuclease [Sedimenticola sp.]